MKTNQHSSKKQQKHTNKTLVVAIFAIAFICGMIVAYQQVANATESDSSDFTCTDSQVLMEVGGTQPSNSEIIEYTGFTVSFNNSLRIPNYVSWELLAAETEGTIPRDDFKTDFNIKNCAKHSDYTHSGYDRGHMAPAADMKWSEQSMNDCFYMTNICPQAGSLNGGSWKKLEEKCRLWAQVDSAIIIVCGPVPTTQPLEYIGSDNDIAVPEAFFKVICSPYANPPRAIGFIMPNGKVPGGLQKAAVSVDSVEALTGYDFFAALPDSIENAIESECRFHYWSTLRPE